ncbi:hypothetical protein HLASF_0953 [Halanaeroarchaeum sulfurireducens]|uniref:Uncharacterized protein n=1 Tax=Halanaeroarchaeum sulfurireducens TaxID=1604004 RepID=A0A0F7PDN0_9EURY|nr:hypothetical protein HLASF_0953 [Halanaeroarchaeum sulfurireducens]ALG81839.1 hypothetical protein HLASA_0942 [Halanaeroarchaeum sulfurireducens]
MAADEDTSQSLVEMAGVGPQYPILVDTDGSITVANSSLWDILTENIGLTERTTAPRSNSHMWSNMYGAGEGRHSHVNKMGVRGNHGE